MILNDPRVPIIAEHHGLEHQLNKLVEEMAELTVAIMHIKKADNPEKRWADVIEELGDVMIVASDVQHLLPETDKMSLSESISYKLNRELVRIGAAKELNHG